MIDDADDEKEEGEDENNQHQQRQRQRQQEQTPQGELSGESSRIVEQSNDCVCGERVRDVDLARHLNSVNHAEIFLDSVGVGYEFSDDENANSFHVKLVNRDPSLIDCSTALQMHEGKLKYIVEHFLSIKRGLKIYVSVIFNYTTGPTETHPDGEEQGALCNFF